MALLHKFKKDDVLIIGETRIKVISHGESATKIAIFRGGEKVTILSGKNRDNFKRTLDDCRTFAT